MVEFRRVLAMEDVKEVARLAGEIWNEHYVSIIGQEQVDYMVDKFQSESAVARQVVEDYEYYLILHHGEAVGYVAIIPEPDTARLMLSKIYIHKRMRGQGLGNSALAFVENRCRALQCRILWLTVNKHNQRSIAWYEHVGFTNVGSTIQDIGAGFVMDDFKMEKAVLRLTE